MRNLLVPACLGLLVAALSSAARAETAAAEACLAANRSLSLGVSLPRTAAHLKEGQSLKIVAVGSSSTTGLWMLSADATYPEVMGREITELRPATRVKVINSGRVGDTVPGMISRFGSDVLAHHPDLVIWQLGTNSVLRDHVISGNGDLLTGELTLLKLTGADVVLINPQYAPKVLAHPEVAAMVELMSATAKASSVELFDRFAIMKHWRETRGMPFQAFLNPDLLHMNDWGYDCVAQLLADAITDAATRAPLTAGMPIPVGTRR